MRLDMLLGKDGTTRCDLTHQRQAHLITQGVFQLNTTRCPGYEIQHTFALQSSEVFLSGVRRLEAELSGDLSARRRHTSFIDNVLN